MQINDELYKTLGDLGYTGSYNDRWTKYLRSLMGYGSYNDMLYTYLGALGFTGTLDDRWRKYLAGKDFNPFPTGYLDFTNQKYATFAGTSVQPRSFTDLITFSRTSNATVTDSDGLIKYAPHNLLANSESFDSTTYSKVNATVTANAAIAPNGTTTADKFIADATANQHRLRVTGVATTDSNICSIYAKAAEYDWIILQGGGSGYAYFDVNNGVVGTQVNTVGTIESVGDGWFRCSVALTGSTTILDIWVTTANGTTSFTGDGTSGVYIWGAQLINQPCVSNDYVSTSPANLLGFTEEFDNAAWTKSNSFVQTNLLTYSEQFDNAAWIKLANTFVTANYGVAPNGTTTADRLVMLNTSGTFLSQNITSVIGVTYTFSLYAKATSGSSYTTMQLGSTIQEFALTEEWTRVSVSFTATGTSLTSAIDNGSRDIDILIWGAQLVQGSTAGEYTQTGASTAAITYTDPFGVKYARKLVEDTVNTVHQLTIGSGVVGQPQTYSIYAKAGERSKLAITGAGFAAQGFSAFFDLANGTLSVNTGNKGAITSVGNGWYRCSISFIPSNTGSFLVYILDDSNNVSYTGDGTSGVYISGAQLSNSASLDPYVYNPTTAITSAARYMPRFNYSSTGEAQGLLIEEQRTNSIRNNTMVGAVAGTPGTAPTNWTITGTADGITREIVGIGVESGVTYIDIKYSGTSTGASFKIILPEPASSTVAASGQSWTSSTYIKVAAGSTANCSFTYWLVGATALGATTESSTLTPSLTSSLQRIALSRTLSNASTARIYTYLDFTFLSGVAIDITLRIGLPQLEQGAFATSVIPTFGSAAVTRNADNASILGRNFASWYNQSEGTVYADFTGRTSRVILNVSDNSFSNRLPQLSIGSINNYEANVVYGGSVTAGLIPTGTHVFGTFAKMSFGYRVNECAAVVNGSTPSTAASVAMPNGLIRLDIGAFQNGGSNLNGTIKSINYWPTRLTNQQIVAITS